MKFGAIFPTCEIGNDPIAIKDWAQAAESLGYAHIVAYDHVLGAVHADRTPPLPGPYDETHAFHEPMVLLGFLAGVTHGIELATGVIVLPQRQTALVAKQAAEVAVLSGGRLRLGVGTGWNRVEYESLGVEFRDRGRMIDEQVDLLRALWSDPVVDFSGEFHRLDRASILPRPATPIPVWFGGFSDVAIRRAARIGDGFIFNSPGTRTLQQAQRLRDELALAGRDPAAFPIELTIPWGLGPEKWVELNERAQGAAITHVCVNTMTAGTAWAGAPSPGLLTVDGHIEALEQFINAVG